MAKSPIPVRDDALGTRELLLTLNKRLAVAAIASALSAVAMSAVVVSIFPLKETVPYVIEVAKDGSASVPPQTEAAKYEPKLETISFFVRRWLQDAFTINQYSTVKVLDPRARLFLRGNTAIGEYKDFLIQDRKFERLAEDPALVRDVEVLSITPVAGVSNGVIADVQTTTRSGSTSKTERKLVTIYFEIVPPDNRKDVEANPIGIFIVDFKVGTSNEK